MDGYAVRCLDLPTVPLTLPVSQRIAAGQPGAPLAPGTAARIFTGAPIPPGADAVVMQESTAAQDGQVEIREQPTPGQWVRRAGIDIAAGACVLPAGHRLRPQDLGLLASVGARRVEVRKRVRVALLCTGDELVAPGEPLPPGRIYDSNRYMLCALVRALGCEAIDLGPVRDTLADTRAALARAAGLADVILSSGGMSVGEEDHVRAAVEAEGALDLWQVAMKPGRPLAFGHVLEVPFVGLPGNPVSSFVTFVLLAAPFLRARQGVTAPAMRMPVARPMRADFSTRPDRRREFLRVRVNAQGGLDAYPNQNSAVLSSCAWGDGLVDNPAGRAIGAGDVVEYLPFAELMA
jgi:molybdopterin molybdotransferase